MHKWEWTCAYFALCKEGGWIWVYLDSKGFKICEQFSFSLDVSCLQVRIPFGQAMHLKWNILQILMQNRNLQCVMHKWHQCSAVLVGNVGFLAKENKSCYKAGWFIRLDSDLLDLLWWGVSAACEGCPTDLPSCSPSDPGSFLCDLVSGNNEGTQGT